MLPAAWDAKDPLSVEGVVASALNAGASSRPPSLRSATPLAVPLVSSSNLDCSQVRVPSARANAESAEVERISKDSRASVLRAKVIPHFKQLFLLRAAAVCFQRQLQILNAMAVFHLVERIARYSDASIQYPFQVVQIALPACNHGQRHASHASGNKEAAGDLASNSSRCQLTLQLWNVGSSVDDDDAAGSNIGIQTILHDAAIALMPASHSYVGDGILADHLLKLIIGENT